ncbi:hypothetical protein [Aliikangiella coralliicola]|uniref:Secreted protein n=1 Tax=Aliikangiella coralliicola TaxID=2592383 RepID=A0A545UJB1_9GAMM|nr:hypothetical protein [Aliikangiella coralliicola]TQV89552.1 hypothetical protein FLL46_01320 [Aliikangiella coralliicola]
MKQSIRLILIFISLTGISFSWAEEKNESEQTESSSNETANYYYYCSPYPDCSGNSDQSNSETGNPEWLKWLESLRGNAKNNNESEQKQ